MAGEHLLVTGANGSGKSTLLTWMGRRSAPTEDSSGSLTVSGSVFWIPQHLPVLGDPGVDEDVWVEGVGDRGQGALHPRLWNRPLSELSDGNQRRAQLALAAAAGPEVLVVDEPTNYLDLDALEMLEIRPEVVDGHAHRRPATTAGSLSTGGVGGFTFGEPAGSCGPEQLFTRIDTVPRRPK